jgi:hypothetical protein
MLYTSQNAVPRYAILPAKSAIQIVDHKTVDQKTSFIYSIPITIDQSVIGQIDGDLQIRGFLGQKRKEKIVVKKSVAIGENIFKNVNRQRMNQLADRKFDKKFFVKKFIDRPDFSLTTIDFQVEIPSEDIDNIFTIEIVNIKTDGSIFSVDSIEIDHETVLKNYDLPNQDFYFTTTRMNGRKIFAAASTSDNVTGAFKFYLKNDASTNFLRKDFENLQVVPTDTSNKSTAVFDVPDNDQCYTVLAQPVSRFYQQELGNFRQIEAGFVKNVKQIPFYMSTISDKEVSFRARGMDSSITRIILYRQLLPSGYREIVESVSNVGNSVVVTDKKRNPQYDFIYSIDYIGTDGVLYTSPSEVFVPSLKLDSLASIAVSRISDENDEQNQNIVFDARVSYKTSSIVDQIVKDLKTLGLENLLSSELEKTTNNLKPLIRVLVTQVSLVTGVETSVGIFEPGIIKISTKDVQSNNSIFRFEVAVRSVPEALENITAAQNFISTNAYDLKSDVDLSSKLIGNKVKSGQTSYSAKFFTKNSIRNSLLRYGTASNLSDISFYAGRTGIFYDVAVGGVGNSDVKITNVSFLPLRQGSYVMWSISGNSREIDLFEINADGTIFYSYPTSKSVQVFHLGNLNPKRIEVTAIIDDERITSGKVEVR